MFRSSVHTRADHLFHTRVEGSTRSRDFMMKFKLANVRAEGAGGGDGGGRAGTGKVKGVGKGKKGKGERK